MFTQPGSILSGYIQGKMLRMKMDEAQSRMDLEHQQLNENRQKDAWNTYRQFDTMARNNGPAWVAQYKPQILSYLNNYYHQAGMPAMTDLPAMFGHESPTEFMGKSPMMTLEYANNPQGLQQATGGIVSTPPGDSTPTPVNVDNHALAAQATGILKGIDAQLATNPNPLQAISELDAALPSFPPGSPAYQMILQRRNDIQQHADDPKYFMGNTAQAKLRLTNNQADVARVNADVVLPTKANYDVQLTKASAELTPIKRQKLISDISLNTAKYNKYVADTAKSYAQTTKINKDIQFITKHNGFSNSQIIQSVRTIGANIRSLNSNAETVTKNIQGIHTYLSTYMKTYSGKQVVDNLTNNFKRDPKTGLFNTQDPNMDVQTRMIGDQLNMLILLTKQSQTIHGQLQSLQGLDQKGTQLLKGVLNGATLVPVGNPK